MGRGVSSETDIDFHKLCYFVPIVPHVVDRIETGHHARTVPGGAGRSSSAASAASSPSHTGQSSESKITGMPLSTTDAPMTLTGLA